MHTFFYSWRRRAGVAMLVVACAMAGMWVRSCAVSDFFRVASRDHLISAELCRGEASIWLIHAENAFQTLSWEAEYLEGYATRDLFVLKWPQYHLVLGARTIIIPHWQFEACLILFSAYLLLAPSRKRLPTASQPHA